MDEEMRVSIQRYQEESNRVLGEASLRTQTRKLNQARANGLQEVDGVSLEDLEGIVRDLQQKYGK